MTTPTIRLSMRASVGEDHREVETFPSEAECRLLLGPDCFRRDELLDHLRRNLLGRMETALREMTK